MELLSDQGPEFLSGVVREVCRIANINHIFTSAYHPQTDGLQERFNGTLIQMLSMYVNKHQTDWDQFIPYCLFAYRTAVQESTKETPFYLLYNRDARHLSDAAFQQHRSVYVPFEDDPVKLAGIRFTEANELALQQIQLAQNKQKRYYDRKVHQFPWRIGDKVFLFTPVTQPGLSHKLTHMWDGLFEIRALVPPRALLANPSAPDLPPFWVHVNRLKPHVSRASHLTLPSDNLPTVKTKPKPPKKSLDSLQPNLSPVQSPPPVKYMTRFQGRKLHPSSNVVHDFLLLAPILFKDWQIVDW